MPLIQPTSPRRTSLSRWWLSLLVLGALWLLPGAAWAQFAVTTSQYKRTPSVERNDAKLNLTISAKDCEAGGYFSLPVSGATVGNTVAIRAGVCDANNYNDEKQCRLLKTTHSVKESNFTLEIPFNEIIVAKRELVGKCTSTNSTQDGCTVATACTDMEDGATTDVTLTISLDSSSIPSANVGWDVAWDLAGPDGPTGVSIGLGEEQLKVSWKALNDSDIDGYRFFCEPIPGTKTQSFEPMGPAGGAAGASGASAGGTSGLGGSGGTSGGTGGSLSAGSGGTSSAGAAGAGASAGAGGTAGAAGADGTNGCAASALVPGKIPPSANKCGETTSSIASSGTVSGLVNGTKYTIGVAAIDNLGNVGTLSELACDTPEPVDDFYEVYRRAGGEGGNGYCSINQSSAPGMLGLVLMTMGALVWRRRRTQ